MQAEVAALLGPDGAVPGALRILARCGDSQVLIVQGAERHVDAAAGERLAWIDWYESDDAARRISYRCSTYLAEADLPPDAKGWHPYYVAHLKTLVCAAQNLLNIKPIPSPERAPAERRSWTAIVSRGSATLSGVARRQRPSPTIRRSPPRRTTSTGRRTGSGSRCRRRLSGSSCCGACPPPPWPTSMPGARHAGLTREAYASRFSSRRWSGRPACPIQRPYRTRLYDAIRSRFFRRRGSMDMPRPGVHHGDR